MTKTANQNKYMERSVSELNFFEYIHDCTESVGQATCDQPLQPLWGQIIY